MGSEATANLLSPGNANEGVSDTEAQPELLQSKVEAVAPNLLLYSAGGIATVGLAGVAVTVCCTEGHCACSCSDCTQIESRRSAEFSFISCPAALSRAVQRSQLVGLCHVSTGMLLHPSPGTYQGLLHCM